MSRDGTAGFLSAIAAGSSSPVLLFEAEFASGWLRLWTGIGPISWNSYTWTGAGNLVGVSPMTETADLRAVGITISLSGMPSALISTALGQSRQGKIGRVYLGFLNSSGAIVADPYLSFEGRLDVPTIADQGDSCTISISYESRLIDLDRPRERRYTGEDQRMDHPEDRGFDNVASLQDASIVWGRDYG